MSKKLSPLMLDHLRRAPFFVTFWGGKVHSAYPRPFNLATVKALKSRGLLAAYADSNPARGQKRFERTAAGEQALSMTEEA